MPETQQERQEREQQEQQFQQSQMGQSPSSGSWPQSTFDQLFGDQIVNSGIDVAGRDAWQAYFELAEQTLRTARRVSEIQVLSLMQQHIVKQVTASVIGQFQRNPQVLASILQQNPQIISTVLQQNPQVLRQPVQQVQREMSNSGR